MARVADPFYSSEAWKRCRKAYREKVILCERCLKRGLAVPGTQVHHKVRITADNMDNPAVTLNWDNLELLCDDCHKAEHGRSTWRTDKWGRVEL